MCCLYGGGLVLSPANISPKANSVTVKIEEPVINFTYNEDPFMVIDLAPLCGMADSNGGNGKMLQSNNGL